MTSEEKVFIVDQASATHGRPNECKAHHIQALDLDHPSLVRYTRDDHNYLLIQAYLDDCVKDAQKVVQRRYEQRQGMLKASQSDNVVELPSTEPWYRANKRPTESTTKRERYVMEMHCYSMS